MLRFGNLESCFYAVPALFLRLWESPIPNITIGCVVFGVITPVLLCPRFGYDLDYSEHYGD